MMMSASNLQQVQDHFKDYVQQDHTAILAHIVDDTGISAVRRLSVYQNAYALRLIEALQATFPVLAALLGQADFEVLARRYIVQHPSHTTSLRWFGEHMPEFLAAESDLKKYFVEMAHLEWAMAHAFDSSDDPVVSELDVANLPAEAWPELCLKFHSSVSLLEQHWNTTPLYQHSQQSFETTLPAEQLSESLYCLIWRQTTRVHYRTLDNIEASVLKLALAGENFSGLCEALVPNFPEDAALRAASYLKSWIQASLLSRLLPYNEEYLCDRK